MSFKLGMTALVIAALSLLGGAVLFAAPADVAAETPKVEELSAFARKGTQMAAVKLAPGIITGTVLAYDRITPYANTKLVVTNSDTKKVAQTTATGGKGEFTLPGMMPGKYVLTVGEKGPGVIMDVVVGTPPATLTLLMPEPAMLLAGVAPAVKIGGAAIVGVGTAALIAAAVEGGGGGGHKRHISEIRP